MANIILRFHDKHFGKIAIALYALIFTGLFLQDNLIMLAITGLLVIILFVHMLWGVVSAGDDFNRKEGG